VNRTRDGFTLMELLIVVGVVAILLSLILPAVSHARSEARKTMCLTNLRQIGQSFSMYLDGHGQIYPCAQDPVAAEQNIWLWMGRGWRPFLEPFIQSHIDEIEPSVLWCPADHSGRYSGTSYGYSMSFYHSPRQIDSMDSIQHTYSPDKVLPSSPIGEHRVASPAGKILVGEWWSNHDPVTHDYDTEPGWWSWKGTRNFLFADGHTQSLPARQIRPANDGYPDANLTVHGVEGFDVK